MALICKPVGFIAHPLQHLSKNSLAVGWRCYHHMVHDSTISQHPRIDEIDERGQNSLTLFSRSFIMFGKLLVGIVAAMVLAVGGYLYFGGSECHNLPATCPQNAASSATPSSSCCEGQEASCGLTTPRAIDMTLCCDAQPASCEELTVLPREVK